MSPFRAVVDRVIDGDTLWVRVRIRTRQSSPSLNTEQGITDKVALSRSYPKGRNVIVDPIVVDQFGRIVATLARDPT